jgi:hypothetical protein
MGRRLGLDYIGEREQARNKQAAAEFGQLCSHGTNGGSVKQVLVYG